MFFADTLELEGAGNRSHLVGGARRAVAVDPPRDIGQVVAAAVRCGARIAYVAEAHVHEALVLRATPPARRA